MLWPHNRPKSITWNTAWSTCISFVCLQAAPSQCEKHPSSSTRTLFHPSEREPSSRDGILWRHQSNPCPLAVQILMDLKQTILKEINHCRCVKKLVGSYWGWGWARNLESKERYAKLVVLIHPGLPCGNTCFQIRDAAPMGPWVVFTSVTCPRQRRKSVTEQGPAQQRASKESVLN